MKAVVAAFNQEKALVASRGLLRDCTTSRHLREHSFEALVTAPRRPDTGTRLLIDPVPLRRCTGIFSHY